MTTTSSPEIVLASEERSRSIRLEAPVPGTEHGLLHFTWSLDDGQDARDARYSYWLWRDSRERMDRRYSHGLRRGIAVLPQDVAPVAVALWSAWQEGAPDPEGTVRRDTRIHRKFTITDVEPFTTFRNETFVPAAARVLWVCGEGGDRSQDFCTVDLAPSRVPAWESAFWTYSGDGQHFKGNDVIPAWLAELAETARTDLLMGAPC